MSKINNVHLEYERLKCLFKTVGPTKAELVDKLLHEAACMMQQLNNLREQIKSIVLYKYLIEVHKDKRKQQNIILN